MKDSYNSYFIEIYNQYVNDVYKYVYYKVDYNKVVAEEITQDVFLAVYNGIPYFKKMSSEKTWVLKITKNKVNDYYRSLYSRPEYITMFEQDLDSNYTEDEDCIMQAIEREEVNRCMQNLPGVYRNILILKYLDGYSIKEIAKILDRTTKSIENLLQRSKKKFIEMYTKGGEL